MGNTRTTPTPTRVLVARIRVAVLQDGNRHVSMPTTCVSHCTRTTLRKLYFMPSIEEKRMPTSRITTVSLVGVERREHMGHVPRHKGSYARVAGGRLRHGIFEVAQVNSNTTWSR